MIVKTDEEREILREGGKRHARALRMLSALVKPGATTLELEFEARKILAGYGDAAAFLNYQPGGAKRPFPAALCVSVNEEIVHGIPNEQPKTFNDGDVVTIDLGLVHRGLITDAAVTVIAGIADPKDDQLIKATAEALSAGINAARAGGMMGEISNAIERVGKKYGYGSPRELGGHSLGRKVHEEPFVPNFGSKKDGPRLKDGQLLAIEPMFNRGGSEIVLREDGYTYITADHSRSAHVEHTVIITKDGAEILTME